MHSPSTSYSLVFTALLALWPAGQAAAEGTTNGNFETFSGGLPTGWSYTQGDGPLTLQDTTTTSPFTNVYPLSTASVALTDGASTVASPTLQQTIATLAGVVTFGFDFRLSSLGTQPWLIVGQSTSTLNFNNIRIAEAGQFRLSDGTGSTGTPVSLNTWYQAMFVLDYANRTYTTSLTPFGGSATTFGTRDMFPISGGHTSNLSVLRVSDSFGLVGDQNGALSLDNVTVVPEPGSAFLLGMGALALAVRRRRVQA